MRERYRRYHEKNDAQSEKVEMNGDVVTKIEPVEEVNGELVATVEPVEEVNGELVATVEPVEEVVTKTEIEVQENDSHAGPVESVRSTSSSSKKNSKKKKSLFKSNKVTPLVPPSDES